MNSSDSDDLGEEFLTDDTQNFLSHGKYLKLKNIYLYTHVIFFQTYQVKILKMELKWLR